MATAKHAKTVTIADPTQAQLNAQIALGNYPPGTVLADIALASDFNADHTVTLGANENFVTNAQLTAIGNTSGTNTGDQTSIVGITGTKAQFDTAVTDGNFLFSGDVLTLASGVHTPAITAEVNLDATTSVTQAQYMRVGNTITVSGRFTANPTLTAIVTSFELSLPIASNIGAVEDLAGVAFCGAIAGMGAEIVGSVANNTAKFQFVSSDITVQTWSYTFTYRVI